VNPRAALFARSSFAVALYGALVVAGWGVTSLLTNTDVISDRAVGPIVAPIALAISAVVLLFVLAGPAGRSLAAHALGGPHGVGIAVIVGLVSVAVYLLAGAAAVILDTGRPLAFVLFIGEQAPTPYVLILLVAATLATLGFSLTLARTERPRWPWENDGEQ
jgi:hypothetical protein